MDLNKNPIRIGLTFDDVLLVPKRFSGRSRNDINTRTQYSRNIAMNIPVVSSNMDTVTEANMAITIARQGGLGIIHRFMPITEQVKEVEKVKKSESVIIEKPYTLPPDAIVFDAKALMLEKDVSGILITKLDGSLEGIITARDIQFETDMEKPIREAMTPRSDLVVASSNISIDKAKQIFLDQKIEKLPLVKDGKVLTGLITASDLQKLETVKNATKDENGLLRVGAAIGVKQDSLPRAKALIDAGVDSLVVDIAHGHSDLAIDIVKMLRKEFGDDIDICGGNIATFEGAEDLISAGVDSLKCGVGPGSICVTRMVAGSGVPQITAIIEAVRAAKPNNIPVIADGGIRTSGDIAKAIAAGASSVMLGNLLAGTKESPGSPIIRNGRQYKVIRGMASLGASLGRREREEEKKKGSFDDDDFCSSVVPEGVEAIVPYRGSVKEILYQLIGGLKSGMSYCGSLSISEMQKNAEFIQITQAGVIESRSHDVQQL